MENTKKEAFLRLAKSRLERVNEALDVLGNCSNRSAYEYTEEEVVVIFDEINAKVREVKSKFKFGSVVPLQGQSDSRTWKQLAAPLKAHGALKSEFAKEQWGQNCIKFFVKNSIFWFTCYAYNFEDKEKREYGIFLQHPYHRTPDKLSIDQRDTVNALKNLIVKNKDSLHSVLPYTVIAGDEDYHGLAWCVNDLSEFPSDEEAIHWLEEMLDTFTKVFVPLIQQVK